MIKIASKEIIKKPERWAAEPLPMLPYGQGVDQLAIYLDMLLSWNKSFNLCGCHDAEGAMRHLAQDSFFLAAFLQKLASNWNEPVIYDLGAGAGLPGIPLRIVWQKGQLHMIERGQKRALFLANALARLKLANTYAHCADAASFMAANGPAHIILGRAFMPWQKMLSFCRPHLAPGGKAVFMANAMPQALPKNWRLESFLEYDLPRKKHWLWAAAPQECE